MMSFADIPDEYTVYDTSDIVILPVPYEKTATWIKGTEKGPEAIIESSVNLEWYDMETGTEVYRKGIYMDMSIATNLSPQAMLNAVEQKAKKHLDKGKFVVLLGGEHTVSIGAIKACLHKYSNVTIIQFDAHADLRDEYLGSRYNHACVMARVMECTSGIVQIGIRSMDIEEVGKVIPGRVFYADRIAGNRLWHDDVVKLLTENVYITFDLDVFDPSVMPSVGTPEPGGLLWYETLEIVKKIIQHSNLIGFDMVELCPSEGNKMPDYLAAKLLYKMLSYKYAGDR